MSNCPISNPCERMLSSVRLQSSLQWTTVLAKLFVLRYSAPSLKESQSSNRSTPVMTDGSTGKVILDPVSDGLLYNHFLPNLFKWSFFVHTDDVPDDLLKECVWALEMFILELIESSDAQLRAMGHITRRTADNKMAYAKNAMIMHAKFKAAIHMLKPTINRAADAVTHLKHVVEVVKSTSGRDLYSGNRDLFVTYAEALLCNGEENEAQTVLERVLKVEDPSPEGLLYLVKAKALVSRVYRSHGLEQKALKQYVFSLMLVTSFTHEFPVKSGSSSGSAKIPTSYRKT
ncbi:hypothetical protein BKA93DRAFT_144574 [Sparassis latifolia]